MATTKGLGFRKWWLLLLGLAACGGGAKEAIRGGAVFVPTSTARAERAPELSASPDARASSPAPPAEERAGLGTEWGETLRSRVRDVAFVRSDEDRPFALATLRYDDADGVDALVRRAGGSERGGDAEVEAAGAVTVALRDDGGEALSAVHVAGQTLVLGRSGERYSIVLTNHTRHRFEAVVTVDGLDVVNGHPGSVRHRGYLLRAFSSVAINGFRRSQDAVAAFRFASVRDAYASQVGSARDVGVIGAALFTERGDAFRVGERDDDDEARLRATASPFPANGHFARSPRRR